MNNNSTQELLLLFLIGVFASANDVDLANNTSILLLLAIILFGNNSNNSCCCRNTCSCNGGFLF